jgi:hypothetical protein
MVRLSAIPVLIGFGLYFLRIGWSENEIFAMGSGCLAIVIAIVYPFFLPSYQMTVTDEYIEEKEWTTRRIYFGDIWEVSMRFGEVFIKSYKQKPLLIDDSLVEFERVLTAVASRLTYCDKVTYIGDPEEVLQYLHKVIPEDKGPTYPGF